VRGASLSSWQTAACALALCAGVVIVGADSWRAALLVGAAGGAVLATQIRYTSYVAAGVVVVAAAFIWSGGSISDDGRPAHHSRIEHRVHGGRGAG